MDIARFIGPDSSPPQAFEPTFTADARHGRRRGRSGRATPRRVVATPAALPEPDAPDWVTSGRQGDFHVLRATRFVASIALICGWAASSARAATPSSGTITVLTPTQSYSSGPFAQPNPTPTPIVDSEPTCDAAHPCDTYTLTVTLPANYQATHPTHVIQITST